MLLNLFALLLVLFQQENVRSAKQKIGICPLKCSCEEEIREMICQNLTRVEIRQLFGSGGTFVTQFASSLRNLSILDSEMEEMGILPRMPNLLCLSLRGNLLERAKVEWADSGNDAQMMGPAFPSLVLLDLSFNKIPAISRNEFLQFPNLEEVRLEHNRIFSIEWEAFRLFNLRRLILSDNYLLIISEHMLRYSPSLEELDLSRNQLSIAQSSSFFTAQRLKSLNLSRNRLQRFDFDSFSPLFQLESMDLSFNNFTQIPPDLRQFVALRVLNFSGNPVAKLAEGDLVQPMLQTFELSHCPNLRMVEQRAFGMAPNLQFLLMANNPSLQFISPLAFPNNSLLFEFSIFNNSLEIIDPRILELPTRIFLQENPLECGCIKKWVQKFREKIVDYGEAKCRAESDGRRVELANLTDFQAKCRPNPILPFGNLLTAKIGDFFSIYCAPRNGEWVQWKMPNGSKIEGQRMEMDGERRNAKNASSQSPLRVIPHGIFNPVVLSAPKIESSYLGGIFPTLAKPHLHPNQRHSPSKSPLADDPNLELPQQKPRLQKFGEQIRFEVLMAEDEGEYICGVNGTETKLRLAVQRPNIEIKPIEIGSHFVSLAWNDTLTIRAFERVQISLQIRHALTGQIGRIIQLSLHNPWHSYNVVRLRPLTNYTFCLVYSLRQPGAGNNILETAKILFKTCVDAMTEQQIGFWSSLSPTAVGILMAFCFVIFSLFCFRAIYLRFYIWHEAKMRARMNQSMSGQSFLSQSSSLQQNNGAAGGISQSSTFDSGNGGQFLNNCCQQNGQKGRRKRKSAKGHKLLVENEKELAAEQTEDIALC